MQALPTELRSAMVDLGSLPELQDKLLQLRKDASDAEIEPTTLAEAQETLKAKGLGSAGFVDRAVSVLLARLPRFFRFTEYSTLPGRVDFADLARGRDDGPAASDLQTARALLKLAGADLSQLTNETYELRRAEFEAVQKDLTDQVFEYWKQNPSLEVLIDVDKQVVQRGNNATVTARYLEIRLRDTRTGYSNNFEQRSSGFQWFFSFLAAFSEFQGEDAPIVLLDEPALTLHGRAQGDFLRFINDKLSERTPVLYTTHSPFLVDMKELARVRVVEDHGPPTGATGSSDVLAADKDSLFPLQAALGYDIAQSLFIGPDNLVVEGPSELAYLLVLSRLCGSSGRDTLDDRWRILPAGGATNIPTFVSLVGPHLDVTVLADSNARGMQRIQNMVDLGLLEDSRLILMNSIAASPNADIEDLFTPGDYIKLYNRTFGTKFRVNDLPQGDRIVKQIEVLNGGPFDHGAVAEYLLRSYVDITLSGTTLDKFASLFAAINATLVTREPARA